MLAFRTLSILLLATSLTGTALAAGPKLKICGQASVCPAGVPSRCPGCGHLRHGARGAAWRDQGGCRPAASRWSSGLRPSARQDGLPEGVPEEVARVLGTTTCGRSGFALCRKKGGGACTVVKTKKCKDIFPTGSAFRTCADACDGLAALPFPSTMELASTDLKLRSRPIPVTVRCGSTLRRPPSTGWPSAT